MLGLCDHIRAATQRYNWSYVEPLPFHSPVAAYQRQAENLVARWNTGDADAARTLRNRFAALPGRARALPRGRCESD